jgi:6-phosphogluconolactonase (cycloisomerase 2 family)
VNENWWGPDGSLVAFSVNGDGSLTQIDKKNTGRGSISNVIYNNGNAVVIANYETNGIQTFSISSTGTLTLLQTIQWTMSTKGPHSRQDRPRPHQTIVDPTGNFIVVCDLGADRIRILSINKSTSQLTEQTPIVAPAGSGPRHATFYKASNGTQYLFVVSELANTITSYRVTYGNNGSTLSLAEVFRSSQWGSTAVPSGSTGAEVIVSVRILLILI